ncbi:hypothetical protein A176_002611 [Myxococcus hansupus]|uniref:Uncharacterized protein n=1 Tax=Pseudomyxococcus hansupus TaxID=1297742 RepID=A0A0H4WSB3_9BACT|nr:hypothetical protein [Myxococcus hansupus]AKQ65699.1 hypothetical protein A176_002611 [Myxococcus hansupus]
MKTAVAFLAGVATGWMARSTVDTSRGAVVSVATAAFDLMGWTRRLIATEREYLSDLIAEARSRADSHQAPRRRPADASARPMENGREGHA